MSSFQREWRYIAPLLCHPYHQMVLSMLLLVGVALSFYSPLLARFTLVIGLIFEIGLIFIGSSLQSWRSSIDRIEQDRQYDRQIQHFLSQIESQSPSDHSTQESLRAFYRIRDRIEELQTLSHDRRSFLQSTEFQALRHSSLEFLQLLLTRIHLSEELSSRSNFRTDHLQHIEHALLDPALLPADRLSLQKAREDQLAMKARQQQRQSRLLSIESSLMTIPDKIQEIYQLIMTNPYDFSQHTSLSEHLSSLQNQVNLQAQVQEELQTILPSTLTSQDIDARLQNAQQRSS